MTTLHEYETKIVDRIQAEVSALKTANGGTVKAVGDPAIFFSKSAAYTPPTAFVVFDGEVAEENRRQGGAFQVTTLHWSVFIVSKSFGAVNEGRTDAYALIDDVIKALQGFPLTVHSVLFYVESEIVDVKNLFVVYQVKFRCANHRQAV
jgi:hypothetical protein